MKENWKRTNPLQKWVGTINKMHGTERTHMDSGVTHTCFCLFQPTVLFWASCLTSLCLTFSIWINGMKGTYFIKFLWELNEKAYVVHSQANILVIISSSSSSNTNWPVKTRLKSDNYYLHFIKDFSKDESDCSMSRGEKKKR